MQTDLFGLPTTPQEEQFDWLNEEDPAVPTETEEEQPTPEQPAEQPAPDPALGLPQEEVEETAEEEPAEENYRWAGKYEDPQALERGYRELSDLWRRTSETSKANEQRALEMEARNRQLQAELQRAVPLIQQMVAAQQRQAQPRVDEYGEPVQAPQPAGPTPQQVAAYVQQQVAAQTAMQAARLNADMAAQREQQESLGTLNQFFADNGITRGDAQDAAMVDTISYLNDSWRDSSVELGNRESLDIVKEATERPALREVLALKPEYFDSDAGLALARMEASVLEGNAITQSSAAVPASQVGATDGQRKPVTERASGGAGAATINPSGDPWLEIVAAHRADQNDKRSVFFE